MAGKSPVTIASRAGNWVLNPIGETSAGESNSDLHGTLNSSGIKSIKQHSKFFFDNILVAIQIEDTLFNVHKYQLAKSEVFSDMFKMPKPEGDGAEEGSSPEHPIIINGVSASDFTALLTVLYAGQFSSNQPTLNAPLIIPAFRLANMFNFSELRAYLLPLAEENLDDVDKIVFAREFDIKEWLAPAHIHLCQRDDHLSAEEARKLEVDSVLMISRMRERHRTRSSAAIANNVYCHKCCGWQYYGHSGYTCQHCNTNPVGHYLRYSGPGTMEVKTTTNDSALEIEVRKWVEDSYVVRFGIRQVT
ncbi:BTB/POZ domain protein [Rhizoctonia solani AG-3 Rhs1AP]|uniref:BTB/POZ domain protein n=2 Tax=Rhizoctonia solani AG-3 TaxID=1086053 RepID=A0A074RT71_9AGAM|nr:BTB/POZ domain protein [Rhizoctonia solani AG-3 Rhs1AP]KEP50079.1 BTB/POZ domain protein [Rhizoctonia solani 123E]